MKKNTTWRNVLRLNAWVLFACLGAAQLPAQARSPQVAEIVSNTSSHPTRFAQCPQFFAQGKPPVLTPRPKLRELCYEAFAILHSGESRTPVYVAQRLNRRSVEDADGFVAQSPPKTAFP